MFLGVLANSSSLSKILIDNIQHKEKLIKNLKSSLNEDKLIRKRIGEDTRDNQNLSTVGKSLEKSKSYIYNNYKTAKGKIKIVYLK
jgi:hypothetical protein